MSLPENQRAELLTLLNQQQFVAATVTQINKDLQGLFHNEIKFTADEKSAVLPQLVNVLSPVLQTLSKQQPEGLSQFIYRVDLDEKKYIASLASDLSLRHLANLVVEREAQKVYLRLKFS